MYSRSIEKIDWMSHYIDKFVWKAVWKSGQSHGPFLTFGVWCQQVARARAPLSDLGLLGVWIPGWDHPNETNSRLRKLNSSPPRKTDIFRRQQMTHIPKQRVICEGEHLTKGNQAGKPKVPPWKIKEEEAMGNYHQSGQPPSEVLHPDMAIPSTYM